MPRWVDGRRASRKEGANFWSASLSLPSGPARSFTLPALRLKRLEQRDHQHRCGGTNTDDLYYAL